MCRLLFPLLLTAGSLAAQPDLPLMPWPEQVARASGEFVVDESFAVATTGAGAEDPRVASAVARMLQRLLRQTGIPPALRPIAGRAPMQVIVERKRAGVQKLGDDESYHLTVAPQSVRLVATEPLGALRGIETFLQLVRIGPSGFAAPAVDITDHPRFAWRGLSLDVSRHFLPVETIKRTIDGLAAMKLNVLHWHLSDDQGFRVESKRWPRLHEKGSDGLYYKQTEIREVVAYARERGVRVVPEFDIPGHATSWFPGYPNLATGKGPYEIVRKTGILLATMDPTKESTYSFLDGFIGEMAKLFPDAYFHIGGDEVSPRGEWAHAPHVTAFMKKQKLADRHALQAYFNRRVLKIVTKHGKQMEGWDEILHPDLPKSIVIQSWQGQKSLAEAARQGYNGILSAGYYLDLMQPASEHYAVDPLSGETAGLSPEERKRVLGGEAAMWEELATLENIDAKLWPRLAAIAERLWSPESVKDPVNMYRRLEQTSRWLELQGIQHRSGLEFMQKRLAGDARLAPLAIFASVLEPIKGYTRHRARTYTSQTAFDRLVDSIPPESDAAREFRDGVDRFLKSRTAADADSLRARLEAWRANAGQVLPILRSNALLAEQVDVANALRDLCTIGLEAIEMLRGSKVIPDDQLLTQRAHVTELMKPKAEELIQIAPGVKALIEAIH